MDVLIIDDEYLIRHGLETYIEWDTLGFNSVSTAEDGVEALALIELCQPDLILTDIRMPFMTGLEFSEKIKKIIPDVCIIIISGHEEFSYAVAALKLDVFDYILKPVNLIEITSTICRAKTWLEEKQLNRENVYYEQIFNKTIDGSGPKYFQQEVMRESPNSINDCDIEDFKKSLLYGSRSETLNEYNKIQRNFLRKESCPRIILQLVCSNLFFACKHAVEEQGGELEAIMDAPVQMFRSVISQPTIAQMFEFLTPVLSDILDYRDDLSNNQVTQEVENAKKYICQNYKDIGLSLDVVSKHVYISSCYLSVLFKKETGDSFINFLTNVRINKAKELLLSTNLKSYEISYQVGYENPTYFSTLFKKITGLTPMDYKKNLRS